MNSRYEYANEWIDDVMASQFSMHFVCEILNKFHFLLKHIKACLHFKLYQSKYYSAFIQSGYKASFTFS